MNSWLLSGYVNLMAAGMSSNDAADLILTSVPSGDSDYYDEATAALEAAAADCETLAAIIYTERSGDAADSIAYMMDSPYQTYEILTP